MQVLPATECMHVACFITINRAAGSGGPQVGRSAVLASTLCVHTDCMPCCGRQVTKGAHYVLMLFWSASGRVVPAMDGFHCTEVHSWQPQLRNLKVPIIT